MDNLFKETEYQLYNYKNIDALNRITDIKIKKLENDVSTKCISFEEKSAPTNKFSSEVENEVIRRDEDNSEKIHNLKLEKENRIMLKQLIGEALTILDPTEKSLVELRYFSKPKKGWQNVAMDMSMSVENCIIMRKNIISLLSKLINI